jgi:hypothetical protein
LLRRFTDDALGFRVGGHQRKPQICRLYGKLRKTTGVKQSALSLLLI